MNPIRVVRNVRRLIVSRPGPQGPGGGKNGWSPVIVVEEDGERRVMRIIDWTGGTTESMPATGYIGPEGIVESAAEALDVRGSQGPPGAGGGGGDPIPGTDGNDGWSPVFAIESDGERRVLRLVDWIGGEGDKPVTGSWLSEIGLTDDRTLAVDIRGEAGRNGYDGADGSKGWSPVLSVFVDGSRRVLQVTDWTGGQGTKPTSGQYVGALGLTFDIFQAIDIRGATGAQGVAGPVGADGATGPAGQRGSFWWAGEGNPVVGGSPFGAVENDMYIDGANGWIWQLSGGMWIPSGIVQGPTGPTGATGPQGPTGATGPAGASTPIQVDYITTTQTWTRPTGAKWVSVRLWAGGNGGGSGCRKASGTHRSGGGGGAGGCMVEALFSAATVGASVLVTIGAGGSGAAAATTDNTVGGTGGGGGATSFGALLVTPVGASAGGGPGNNALPANGGVAISAQWLGTNGGTGGTNPSYPAAAGVSLTNRPGGSTGGGGGGGYNDSNTPGPAGDGGAVFVWSPAGGAAGTAGSIHGGDGGSGQNYGPGAGGGGGYPGGGNGGKGGVPGGGGGGGGASVNGTASGKGGDGGNGACLITTYF